jgi:hypothetical protein
MEYMNNIQASGYKNAAHLTVRCYGDQQSLTSTKPLSLPARFSEVRNEVRSEVRRSDFSHDDDRSGLDTMADVACMLLDNPALAQRSVEGSRSGFSGSSHSTGLHAPVLNTRMLSSTAGFVMSEKERRHAEAIRTNLPPRYDMHSNGMCCCDLILS